MVLMITAIRTQQGKDLGREKGVTWMADGNISSIWKLLCCFK